MAGDGRMDGEECFICRKHRNEAGPGRSLIFHEDEQIIASLMAGGAETRGAYLGYAILETKRHVAGLGHLSPVEAKSLGAAMNVVSAALMRTLGAEHVYSFVQGDGVPHFHLHLVPRYPGTPEAHRHPTNILQWAGAPRGDLGELERLRVQLAAASSEA